MNLHEYQAKEIFSKYNIPIPKGHVFDKSYLKNKKLISDILGYGPWVAKCQIHAGGRGKAGGVLIVHSEKEIKEFFNKWLGKKLVTNQTGIKGRNVNKILIEPCIATKREMYIGILVDYNINNIVFIASCKGGENIEENLSKTRSSIFKTLIDPYQGPQEYQGKILANKLGLKEKQIFQFTKIFMSLSKIFLDYDLLLAEINPLSVKLDNDLICLDGKIVVDDNSLFRQKKIRELIDLKQMDSLERKAFKFSLNYVSLEGNIGCIVNGAGLAMGTMDMIKYYGGQPANFLDIGGNVNKSAVKESLKIISKDEKVKVILINIFGGIVKCDLVADGILDALYDSKVNIPLVIRLEGSNSKLGYKKLINYHKSNISISNNLIEAIKKSVILSRE